MFPEYRDLISRLKSEDGRFQRLFEQHNKLDHEIKNLEQTAGSSASVEIETKKKEKLQIKDELYTILKRAQTDAV